MTRNNKMAPSFRSRVDHVRTTCRSRVRVQSSFEDRRVVYSIAIALFCDQVQLISGFPRAFSPRSSRLLKSIYYTESSCYIAVS